MGMRNFLLEIYGYVCVLQVKLKLGINHIEQNLLNFCFTNVLGFFNICCSNVEERDADIYYKDVGHVKSKEGKYLRRNQEKEVNS